MSVQHLDSRYDNLLPFPTEEEAKGLIGNYGISCTLAGVFMDTFLFGVFSLQFITYVSSKADDKLWVRGIVAAVTVMACLLTGYNWFYVSGWLPLIDSVTMSFTQLFFAHRAYRLCSKQIWIPICVLICILAALAACVTTRVVFGKLNSELDSGHVLGSTVTWMAATMVADTIITGCILYGLSRAQTKVIQTKLIIARLIRMTLEAQVPATLVALTLMIEVIIDPANMLGVAVILFQSKIYVVGFFYSLNARQRLAQTHRSVTMDDMDTFRPNVFSECRAATIVVQQETEMHVMRSAPPIVGINRHAQPFDLDETKGSISVLEEASLNYKGSSTEFQDTPPHTKHVEIV
ncbi:hypothetical protein CspeluHIS016_0403050 [Cutaneotrichosporon spelunceum]|uniref:DUF6534 domain-containing protein n=1 Tax=Cutaneotrichosporon spelunceum TaxID=1672016 RepID=A0AAD3YBX6_9TREE|nr:hypothetical protein CspeluHIS016_0403050 [Cutaneotrichosporon spelunceum]